MPELKKILVAGGGLAGIVAAICARRADPACAVVLLEKGSDLVSWTHRRGLQSYPVAGGGSVAINDRPDTWHLRNSILEKWGIEQLREIFGDSCGDVFEDRDGSIVCRDLAALRGVLGSVLQSHGIECVFGYTLESVSRQPDGAFRLWSREGESVHGHSLVLATGGERNHGMKIARELGEETSQPIPAFVRLKLASPKLGDRMGPVEREVQVRCLKTGTAATGLLRISSKGMEGDAVSRLSASLCALWNQLNYHLQIEVDWLPGQPGSSVLKEICSRRESGGKRHICETPMFSFPERSWNTLLDSARIAGDTPWTKIRMKKLQALANRIKADRYVTGGMGLPEAERAWSGGVNTANLNQRTLGSRMTPGLYFAGEILCLHGSPGGNHQHLMLATGCIAGRSAALDE